MMGAGLARRLGRRWLATALTGVCAMAVVTTSRTAEPELFFRASSSLHDVVLLQGESTLEVDVVQRLSPGSRSSSRGRDNLFSAAIEGVHHEAGPPLDHDLLPEVTLTAVAPNGSRLGDTVGPGREVDLRHPHACPLDEGCVRRYLVLLDRPGPASRQLRVQLRLTTETHRAEDSPNVSAMDHVMQVRPIAARPGDRVPPGSDT